MREKNLIKLISLQIKMASLFIICNGRIELDSNIASKNEILNCILNSPTTIGVVDYSRTKDENSKMCFVKGKWQYSYYINSGETSAGTVEFKYQFNISDGYIDYNYYDFIHTKDDSDFESIGFLPYKFNGKVSKVFTEKQFEEIVGEIFLNQLLAIKRTKKYTDKCFK
ncbi:MAG: hypothetical protein ACSHW7_09930 [Patiriisocius sp.]|uniref:hypothetical protein n=1 Tax=Patiriisocius sp. TaxID=2822396 RepID=UPI003EF9BEBC